MRRRIAALALVGALLAPALAEGGADRTSVFRVEGMTCGLCAKAIEKALGNVQGVQRIEIDQEAERVTVVADAELTPVRLEDAIESAGGYEAVLVQ
ncbi:MAG: heavy metal-associated domain-containing protein [Proteobacteria bacterium]|nr:heavy metal-associated domain-containing protein [Pseudomonadota bacterium]